MSVKQLFSNDRSLGLLAMSFSLEEMGLEGGYVPRTREIYPCSNGAVDGKADKKKKVAVVTMKTKVKIKSLCETPARAG